MRRNGARMGWRFGIGAGRGIGACLLVLAGCGRGRPPEAPAPTAPVTAAADTAFARYAVEPVPVPRSFAAAVEAGTRTMTGRPGARYWQQEVAYRIDAELDPATARIQGEETVTYTNHSPDTLRVLVFHLYQNLFREGVQRTRSVPITGGMMIERVAVDGRPAVESAGAAPGGAPAYEVSETLMYVRLPRPLAPGGSVDVDVAWRFAVPPQGAPRTGHIDRRVYNVAQWYPQVAVYDDVEGWHAWPYLGNAEFYLEYGDFDVSLTLPEGWVVAATGELQNADEVLTAQARARLRRALEGDRVVHVIAEEDLGPGNATQRVPGGQLTWRFVGRDVRDFAWAASNEYVWDATRAVVEGEDGEARVIPVYAYYRPQAETWTRAAEYTRHGIEYFSERYHPYIYPQMTSVEGPVGGMEYPMIVFVRDFGNARTLASVVLHEVAHEWWPMMVGSKETSYAWQDEGLATYIENRAVGALYDEAPAFGGDLQRYLAIAGSDAELPIMRHADLYGIYAVFATASYSKPAVLLRALGGVIGEETVTRALRAYADRWLLKHPYPLDFFNTVEDVAGRDLDWFWHPWWYETAVLDQAIEGVRVEAAEGGERVVVTIADEGGAPMPVELVVTTAEGATREVVVPVDVWLAGARRTTATVTVPGRVAAVAIDPDRTFPDVDRDDNIWRRAASSGAR
ncbi:MAG TPA: M1 family metallopeptidase [Longimicrobiales bacterium]